MSEVPILRASRPEAGLSLSWGNLIQTSIHDEYSGSLKSTTRLDHIVHWKNSVWYKLV